MITFRLLVLELNDYITLQAENLMNIDRLGDLVNLKRLSILRRDIRDISWMANLQNLQELSLHKTTVDDISPLAELPNLVSVGLYSVTVRDLTPLLESKSIKIIYQSFEEYYDSDKHGHLLELGRQFSERGIEYSRGYSDR